MFSAYEQRLALWQKFQRNLHDTQAFVQEMEKSLADWRSRNKSPDLEEMERSQLVSADDLEKRMVVAFGASNWDCGAVRPTQPASQLRADR